MGSKASENDLRIVAVPTIARVGDTTLILISIVQLRVFKILAVEHSKGRRADPLVG